MQLLPAPAAKSDIQSELTTALAACCGAFIATATFSGMSKRVDATGAIFMLELYDRVLPSHSVPTLIALIAIAAASCCGSAQASTRRSATAYTTRWSACR